MGRKRQDERDAAIFALGARTGAARERQRGFLRRLLRIARRLFRAETQDLARMLSEQGPERTIRALGKLITAERWQDGFREAIEEIMDDAPIRTDRGNVSLSFDLQNPAMADYFEGYLVTFSEALVGTTRQKVTEVIREAQKEGLSVPDTAKRVEALGDDFDRSRANLVARQELLRSSKGAARIKAEASGIVTTKTRRSAKDSRVRPEHRAIDGETRPLNEPYSNGEQFCGQHDFACRCVDIYGVE